MRLLPPPLQDVLRSAPTVVIAPVGLGFAQEALSAWAIASGRKVRSDPSHLPAEPSLLVCSSRSQLTAIPHDLPLEETLVLEEADVCFDAAGWRRVLSGSPLAFAEASFREAEGWPAGLELALKIGDTALALHQHPLASLALERLLPKGEMRLSLERAAKTPLLISELYEPLGLQPEAAEELLDRGYLIPVREGLILPKLLRSYLRPQLEPAVSLAVATILMHRRHLDEALSALAEGELWDSYLEYLAAGFEPHASDGEARLRRALGLLPQSLHERAEYLYLVGSLERLRGDPERALSRYRAARRSATAQLRPRIDNARGIAYALQGKLTEARKAFGAAIRGSTVQKGAGNRLTGALRGSRLQGEARHNRAGVFIQQGRFAEAEKDLRQAVASFREGGEYVREARGLQQLALSWHRRGLLREARKGYEEALELLGTLGQPTALLRTNLAEVLLLMGRANEAKAELEQAADDSHGDARILGYVEANLALWTINQGQPEVATRQLTMLLRQEGLEAHLRAEAELLLARALRLQEQREEAAVHARAAAPLGVAAELEQVLCEGGDLERVIAHARDEEARFELATALLSRGAGGDVQEALELVRAHDYRILLDSPQHAPTLAALAEKDPATLELFPLRMTTFAGFRVRFLGRSLSLAEFPTRKSAALLLRLALATRPLPRETLAEEFWGDARNPAHSLQTALYHLNRTLNAQVVGGRKGVVELLYPVVLDLTDFVRIAGETLENSWAFGSDGVRRSLALAEGEPLADFPEWFDEERRRAEALLLRLWRRLAELEAAQPQRAAEALEMLLRLDPYDVESRKNLIGIYAELGESEQARRQEEHLRLLESEL